MEQKGGVAHFFVQRMMFRVFQPSFIAIKNTFSNGLLKVMDRKTECGKIIRRPKMCFNTRNE